MSHDRFFMCGHKGSITGAQYRRGLWMLCAKCNAARKAAA
jgi:hypothetical protein